MAKLARTITTTTSLDRVYEFLSDLATTEVWDPNTVRCHRVSGDGGVGTVYENTSRFRDRATTLRYEVTDRTRNRRYSLRGENRTVRSVEDMNFRSLPDGGTEIVYTAEFIFRGVARLAGPFLGAAFTKLGDDAQRGMTQALDALGSARDL